MLVSLYVNRSSVFGSITPRVEYLTVSDPTPEQTEKLKALHEGLKALNVNMLPGSSLIIGQMYLNPAGRVEYRAFDAGLDEMGVWATIDAMFEQLPALMKEHQTYMDAQEVRLKENRAKSEAWAVQREKEKAEREAQKQAEREFATYLDWDEEGKVTLNLFARLLTIADVERDDRFTAWAKDVTHITSADNGYAFEGAWVSKGTVEIDRRPRLFLLATTTGSRRYQTTTYSVVILNAEGRLESTDIQTDSSVGGWALRMRKPIQAKLAELGITA